MSCYRCAEPFKFFRKEIGCGNCGFGFCSKCCSNKYEVPKKENKKLPVCVSCYDLLKKGAQGSVKVNQNTQDLSPPENFKKLVEANKEKNMVKNDPNKNLIDRLEKLKETNKPNVSKLSDSDLEARLRALQGVDPNAPKLSNLPSKEIVKTSDDLINKIMEEVDIEKKHGDFEKEELEKLEARLRNLRANPPATDGQSENASSNIINTDNTPSNATSLPPKKINPADEILNKMLKEAQEAYKQKTIDDEEDTWCCICNNDSNLRCIDCDNDYYCKKCFKQSHNSYEYKQHRKQDL